MCLYSFIEIRVFIEQEWSINHQYQIGPYKYGRMESEKCARRNKYFYLLRTYAPDNRRVWEQKNHVNTHILISFKLKDC